MPALISGLKPDKHWGLKMDNLPPGPCPNCGKAAKPLFNSYYCDCDEVTEKIKKVETDDDKVDYSANLSVGYNSPAQNIPVIQGVQMKYWFECPLCAKPAFYLDRDEKDIHPRSPWVFPTDGVYQMNYPSLNLNVPACDSCMQEFSVSYLITPHLHKY